MEVSAYTSAIRYGMMVYLFIVINVINVINVVFVFVINYYHY